MGTANTVQNRFRWRNDDGSESGATWKAAINTNWTPAYPGDMDVPIRLRFEISNTGTKAEASGLYEIYVDIDGAGYNKITTVTTKVQMVASAYVSDPTTTTEQLAGSQGFQDGEFDSNGSVTAMALAASTDTEHEYCFKMITADLSGGEVLSFRVYLDGSALDGYTNTPTITVPTLPQPEWTQAEFRIRPGGNDGDAQSLNANGAGDWAAAVNTNATLQPSGIRAGTCFGLRFKISAANKSGSKILKIQRAKNGGGWADLVAKPHNQQDQYSTGDCIEIGVFPTDRYTDGAATTQVLSGSSFVAGTGEHDPAADSITLDIGDHTELEWRIFINKSWQNQGANVHGDYFDFRLVESDGTPLTSYTNIPRVTLDYDNDYIGGTYPEKINRFGAFHASDNDMFTFVEDCELTADIIAMRKANGASRWIPVDVANAPAGFSDLEGFHVFQVSDTLHLFVVTGTDVRYETFNMSTHAWGQLDEQVSTSKGANIESCYGARRSDGTTIMFWIDSNFDLVYKERSSGGTWDSSATGFYTGTVNGLAGVLAEADKIYIAWADDTNTTIYSKSLDSANTQGTQRTISTDAMGIMTSWSVIPPVYWDDSGVEKVGIIYQRDTDEKLYWRIISDDGSPGTEAGITDNQVADNELQLNSRHPAAGAVVIGTTIYVVYSHYADYDLYLTKSNNGGTFDTDTEIFDGENIHGVGLTNTSSYLTLVVEQAHIDSISGFTGGVEYLEYQLSGTDNLTADSISTTPALGTPTIGQTHVLSADSISTTPVLGTPTIGQTHVLSADNISTTPVLGTPTIGEIHVLSADSISTTPALGTSTIGQTHVLSADSISTTPVLGTPTIGQTHVLSADSIFTTPVLGTPTLTSGGVDNLEADSISTTPVLGTPTIGQTHVLSVDSISTTPVLGTPTIGQTHVLLADSISTTPVLGTPTVGQSHILSADNIFTTPVLDTPVIGQIHILSADSISTTPVLGIPAIGQTHVLSADNISATPVLGTPTLSTAGTDNLVAVGITVTPVLGTPSIGQEHILVATSIVTTPIIGIPMIGQTHTLSAVGISTIPETGTPVLAHIYNLDAVGITTLPVVGTPSIGQTHILDAVSILVSPLVGVPLIGQTHILNAAGISTVPDLGSPGFTLIEGEVFMIFTSWQPEIAFSSFQPELSFNIFTED